MNWKNVRPLAITVLLLTLIIPALFFGIRSVQNLISSSLLVASNASEVRTMLFSLILKDQLDEETGIRGYAGTRQKLFLEPYQTASARMNADFDQVGRRLQKLGVNSALYILADATATNDRWKHVIAAPIIAMQPYNPLIQRTGKVLIDRFRRDVIRLDDIIRTRQFKLDTIERLAITRVSVLNFVLVFLIIVLAVSAGGMRFLKMYRREQSIAIAYQEASLPRKLPEVLGIVFHSFYSPGKNEARVGGDWYDAIRLLDGRIIISIGDVAGSGLKAAVIMANMRQVIRGSGYVNPDPVLMLNAADKMLRAEYPDTTVTAFVGILDAIERTLLYASAGHPPPFLRLPDGTLKMLSSQGLILGLRGRDEPFPEQVVIEDGSRLILYTDGLTEFTRDYQEGEQRLRAALENTDLYTSPNIAEELYNVILSDGAQDDVAILAIEWEPLPIATEGPLSRWTFDVHDADATMHTREAFTQQLKMESISPDDIAMAELVFMELIGNVLRYAPGRVEIAVDWSGACPVLHAIDHGPGFSHNPKLPDLFAESGRGIYLVSMLTETFEVLKVPGGGSHACAVLLLGNPNVRERKHRLKHIDSGTCSAFSYPDDARRFRQAKEPIQI